jgi:hypothetical protein
MRWRRRARRRSAVSPRCATERMPRAARWRPPGPPRPRGARPGRNTASRAGPWRRGRPSASSRAGPAARVDRARVSRPRLFSLRVRPSGARSTTELEFHALSEDMPPLEAPPSVGGDELRCRCSPGPPSLPFEAPFRGTDPMGRPPVASSLGDEDTLVRAMEQARGRPTRSRRCPGLLRRARRRAATPRARAQGNGPLRPRPEPHSRTTDPYATRSRVTPPPGGTDELPTPPAQPFAFPAAGGQSHPVGGNRRGPHASGWHPPRVRGAGARARGAALSAPKPRRPRWPGPWWRS